MTHYQATMVAPRALVLAAGRGVRFGGRKLDALYRGRPLLSHVLGVVEAACERRLLDGGCVVVAAGDENTADVARETRLTVVINHEPYAGLSHSLRVGLNALSATPATAAMIFLADQPTIRLEVVQRIVDAWQGDMHSVIRPRYGDRPAVPGHPVLLSRALWQTVSQLEGDHGFAALLNPDTETMIDIPGDNPDIDTLEDLQLLEGTSE